MMQWINEQLMEVEVSKKVTAQMMFTVKRERSIVVGCIFAGLIVD